MSKDSIVDASQDKIDNCLQKIDKNLSTFTTDQFLQLRKIVEEVGFAQAAIDGQELFGLEKGIDLMKVFRKKEVLKRKLVAPNLELDCTGFLSTPNIMFSED